MMLPSHPQRVLTYMAQRNLRASVGARENVLSFERPSKPGSSTTALNLVDQAAEAFDRIEDHARETEARAQCLRKSALEKLKSAEVHIDAAERVSREIIVDAEGKLQDASRALSQAQSRMEAIEDKLTAAEFRAQAAEAKEREAKRSARPSYTCTLGAGRVSGRHVSGAAEFQARHLSGAALIHVHIEGQGAFQARPSARSHAA